MTEPIPGVPQEPTPTPPAAAEQVAAQEIIAQEAQQADAIRALAAELQKPELSFDPATIRKGTITAIDATANPPTLTLTLSGDTDTPVAGVRYLDSYSPIVGDTAIIIKQGTDILAIGRVAQSTVSGWVTATLAAGFSHNANSGGNVQYRKVWDAGAWKVQWRGMLGRSSGTTIITALPTDVRPSTTVSLITARNSDDGQCAVKIDISTAGAVTLVDGDMWSTSTGASTTNTGGSSPNTGGSNQDFSGYLGQWSNTQNNPNTGFTVAGGTNHAHTIGHEHWINDHRHTIGHEHTVQAHSHSMDHFHQTHVDFPSIVSFHGLEYFI